MIAAAYRPAPIRVTEDTELPDALSQLGYAYVRSGIYGTVIHAGAVMWRGFWWQAWTWLEKTHQVTEHAS